MGPETNGLRRLHNEDWGFESNCFVCEPRNDGGLQIPFHHDPEREVVVATFTLGDRFSGAPSYVHGEAQGARTTGADVPDLDPTFLR